MKTYKRSHSSNSTKRKRKYVGGGCNSSILDQYINSNITMSRFSNNSSIRQYTEKSDYALNHMKNRPGAVKIISLCILIKNPITLGKKALGNMVDFLITKRNG